MISEEIIEEAINRLIKAAKPRMIYLFGSYARGDARKQSDLDFLVIEEIFFKVYALHFLLCILNIIFFVGKS